MKSATQFVRDNTTKIVITIIVTLLLDVLSQFPYLGSLLIFPYPIGKFFALWLFISLYFHVNATFSRILALFWLIFASIGVVFQRESIAGSAGIVCVVLLVVSFIQEWYEERKT